MKQLRPRARRAGSRFVLALLVGSALYHGAWGQAAFSARSTALGYAAHAFADDALAPVYNPSLMARARLFDSSLSFTQLPFQNNGGAAAFLLPVGKWVTALDLGFVVPDATADNPIYVDGIAAANGLLYGDFTFALGAATALSRNLSLGFAVSMENYSFYNQHYFTTWLNAGARWETRLARTLPWRLGANVEKKLFSKLASPVVGIEQGLRLTVASSLGLPAIRSEVGLALGFADGDAARIVNASNASFFDSLGIAFEALRDFYLSPKVSLRLPLFEKSMALAAGLTAGIPLGGARYEFGYALVKEFTADPVAGAFRHHFSLSIRGHLDPFSRVQRSYLVLPEKALRFAELVVEPRPSAALPGDLIDKRVRLRLDKPALPGDRGAGDELVSWAGLVIESRVKGMPNARAESPAELALRPELRIEGELLSLKMEALHGSEALFSKTYTAEYARPLDREDMVDRVRTVSRGKARGLLAFSESFHAKKNKQSVLGFLAQFEADFAAFLEGEFLKAVTVTANLPNAQVTMNGLRLGALGAEGLRFKVKPGRYAFQASKRGYPDVSLTRQIDAPADVVLAFPTNTFSVNVEPVLLGDKSGVELAVGGKSQRLRKGQEQPFEEVLSTNASVAVGGFYAIQAIPLRIDDSRDRRIYLMPDFTERFRESGFWASLGDGGELRPRFTGQGLEIRGLKEGMQPGARGIQTPPFFAKDFSLSFMAASEEGGMGLVSLIGEGARKWTLVITRTRVWVQSDHEGAGSGEIKARSLMERDQVYRLVKIGRSVKLTLGDAVLYTGAFPEAGNLRLFIGADGSREGERILFNMPELVFKHL